MNDAFSTTSYVRGLTMAGFARAQAQTAGALSVGEVATRPDLLVLRRDIAQALDLHASASTREFRALEARLMAKIDTAASQMRTELKHLRSATLLGMVLLCLAVALMRVVR